MEHQNKLLVSKMRSGLATLALTMLTYMGAYAQETINLAGKWALEMSPAPNGATAQEVELPGSLTEMGIGNVVSTKTQWVGSLYDSSYFFNPKLEQYRREGQVKLPFFLTPKSHYVGEATYTRTIDVPSNWKGRKMTIFLERPHIVSTLVVNGQTVGSCNSLSVPHVYDVTKFIKPGKANTVSVIVRNDPDEVGVGQDSHSVTDQTQGCWNGIVGRMELISTPKVSPTHIDVYPDVEGNKARVVLKSTGKPKGVTINVTRWDAQSECGYDFISDKHFALKGDSNVIELDMTGFAKWDDKSQTSYELSVRLDGSGAEMSTTFGMRNVSIDGRYILINGERQMMRGTVENCNFPLTGYPPTDYESWERVMQRCKAYGINHIRFHSYCPPEAAFCAADNYGIYLQPEGPSWPNHGVSLGRGEKIDAYLMLETERMVEAYGNHPSFVMMAAGNEPRGRWVDWCSKFVEHWRAKDSRRIYTGASVGGGWQWQPKNQYHVKAGARGLTWDFLQPSSDDNFDKEIDKFYDKATKTTFDINEPFIAHEMGQWCAFPDLEETDQYTGAYKAYNFDIFRNQLAEGGMGEMGHRFHMSSGKLQKLCYKYEIERVMRTADYAGFQLLGLNDYSGQGSALVGVTNVFFNQKEYCTPEEFREFCSPVVPLAQLPKFVYTDGEKASVEILVSNYLKELTNVQVEVSFGDDTKSWKKVMDVEKIGMGLSSIGTFDIPSDKCSSMHQTLTVRVGEYGKNHWDYWVFPAKTCAEPANVMVTDTLDAQAQECLRNGGRVLLCAAGKISYGANVKQMFLPVFWNTSWFKMRPPHTTGCYVNNHHPALHTFPTDNWSDLQWWELVNKCQAMQLTEMPESLRPIVQPIDTWFVSRKLANLFEARVGKGLLMVTSMDISNNLDTRPAARQLRQSILSYMAGTSFRPETEVTIDQVLDLFRKKAPILDMYTKDSPDELKPKIN